MPNVGTWRLQSVSEDAHTQRVCLECHDSGIFKCGQGKIALEVYQKMQQEGVQPDSVTFVGVLNACASVMALEQGRRIHERIIQSGCESDV
jgi:pentatricopeptide repeat protein